MTNTEQVAANVPWCGRLRNVRNKLLQNPSFRKWAFRFPLSAWLARRKARQLFDLTAGFVYSQVLYACVELKLFESLSEGPRTLDQLATDSGLAPEQARRLLNAACALELLHPFGDEKYGLGELGAVLSSEPGIAAMIRHHKFLYADLADPIAMLKQYESPTQLSKFWAYAKSDTPRDTSPFIASRYTSLMAASQGLIAQEILDAYDLIRYRNMLDIGGGDGTFLSAVAQRYPDINLTLYELPAVATLARQRLASHPYSPPLRVVDGDFRRDPLPVGADIISLIRILHDHDDYVVRTLLVKVRQALVPGGAVLIGEPLADTPGEVRMGHAYFGMYLAAMRQGQPRTFQMLSKMLTDAGFHAVRRVRTHSPLQTSAIVARRA